MSDVSRISSFAIHQSLTKDVGSLQKDLATYQDQLSSGLKTHSYDGLSGSVELFVDLKSKNAKAQRYLDNITVATARMNTMNTSLDQVTKSSQDIKSLMTAWRSTDKSTINFKQQLLQMRDAISSGLNVSMEGRYLFSGTATDKQPVNTDYPASAVPGTADASYYQGSSQNTTFRAQDNYDVSYNIRADDPAFQNIYGAIQLALQADTEGSDNKMNQAMDMLQKGLDGTINLQASNNVNILNMKDISDRQTTMQSYYKSLSDGVIKTDIVDVSTKVAYDQATLQAAYQAFSAINNLQLSNYLK